MFFIPFLLFHKVGITRELHCFIVSHANACLTISEIQTLWLQTMYDAYGLRRAAYLSACTANSKLCTSYPDFEQKFQNPGEKVIASCIAGNYFKKEHLYTKRMCQMTAGKWLNCDHTFKVSANIGFWLNKRWVKLYDTLFIVLNEEGIVLSWKLCKGTNFSSVENVLKLLKERLHRQGKNPTIFMLDNCCSWRTKVTKVFPNIAVKLDIFHAIQRVIKRIPKKKGCTETITQLQRQKKIFCEPADKDEQRTMDTPSPEIILKNIDNFMRQWKTVEFNSILLLPSSALHEIEKLKGHVTKGCLSGIPPSGGTNRNEALQALNLSCLSSHLKEIKGATTSLSRSASHLVNLKNILCLLSSIESNSAKPSEGDMDEFLASNNMHRVKVPGDGNCFFVSLAIMIKQQLEKGLLTAEGRTHLQQLGVIQGENFEVHDIASALRHVIVNEWLSNPSSYEPFLTSGQDIIKQKLLCFCKMVILLQNLGILCLLQLPMHCVSQL